MNKIVYSTEKNWQPRCEKCDEILDNCTCKDAKEKSQGTKPIYIQREKKGRAGKVVTVISNFDENLKGLQKELQKKCASGGTLKNKNIEIQGDHISKIKSYLIQKGYNVKQVGK